MTLIGNYKVCKVCWCNKKLSDFWGGRTCKECELEKRRDKTRKRCKKEGKVYSKDFKPGHCMYCGAVYPEKKFMIRETGELAKTCNPCRWKRQNKELHYQRKLKAEKEDLKTRLNKLMRNGIRKDLKSRHSSKSRKSWSNLVGYSADELANHLKKSLKKLNLNKRTNYSWDDFLKSDLHIDHIIPISAFNYNSAEDTEFKRCWSLENLQLLPAFDNISKRDKCESFQTTF